MSAAAGARRNDQDPNDLIGDLIAEVARSHGVAIARDDPVIAVVLLNQLVLRRYLEETVGAAAAAIREATDAAVAHIAQLAEAQATWLEQVSLQDRASFLEEQKALHDAWRADMEALIDGQNTALQQVVAQTVARLRPPPPAERVHVQPSPVPAQSTGARSTRPAWHWNWLGADMVTVALGMSSWLWLHTTG